MPEGDWPDNHGMPEGDWPDKLHYVIGYVRFIISNVIKLYEDKSSYSFQHIIQIEHLAVANTMKVCNTKAF